MVKLDMHLHSWYSDGRLKPEDLVLKCQEAGLELMALTDHDNTAGIPEALEAGRRLGVRVIPGVEFAVNDGDGTEHHILGYCFDWQSQALKDFFESWRAIKAAHLEAMVGKLQGMGFQITLGQVMAQARGTFNRSHIGYAVFAQPENLVLLRERFAITKVHEFFKTFLKEDSPHSVYVPKARPGIANVLELVGRLGGISVWTHPFWQNQSATDVALKAITFKRFGLAGLEVLYSRSFHGEDRALVLHRLAQNLNLYETAGSDFHSFDMDIYNKIGDFDTFGIELNLPPCFV